MATTTTSELSRRLASIEAAANYLSVNPRTIRRYIAAGRLQGYRAGNRLIRVDLNEVDAMLRPVPTTDGDV